MQMHEEECELAQVLTEGQSVVYDYEGTNMLFAVTGVTVLDKLNEQVHPHPSCVSVGAQKECVRVGVRRAWG